MTKYRTRQKIFSVDMDSPILRRMTKEKALRRVYAYLDHSISVLVF